MRKIIILGHKGMLGQMVLRYFTKQGHAVITLQNRYEPQTRLAFMSELMQHHNAIVINAIGRIKQKTDDTHELLWANATLPLDLAQHLLPSQTLIHPSTDCVFDGTTNRPYAIDAPQDARDDYGWSKQLGETAVKNRNNTLIIRVSIIGTDTNTQAKGLLGWFLSQAPNSQLNGYSNHLWNGITTLEWCKVLENYLNQHPLNAQTTCITLQPGTQKHYTKHELLLLFQKIFNTTYTIESTETPQRVDRRLRPSIEAKSLEDQLLELSLF